jgi:hypothetical protein
MLNIFYFYLGASHSLVVNEIGEVYSFGEGGDGRLGHGDVEAQSVPRKILGMLMSLNL